MTIRHLKIFLSICNNGCNTTKAAESLHMTQPAVSLAVKELENHYGIALFDRIGRRLQITQAGLRFKEYSSHIISLFNDMEKEMRNWDYFGILRVGASITIGSQFLPGYVKTFYNQFPGTEIHAVIAPSAKLEEKIMNNELDFALIEGVSHIPSLISKAYMEDRLSVICSPDSALYPEQEISIEEFRRQKFLLREHGSGTRETFDRVTEEAGFSISPIWEATSTAALINAVISGLGIAVLPCRMVSEAISQGLVREISVKGLRFQRKFHIIYHKQKFLTASAVAFMELCRQKKEPLPPF